MLYAHIKENNCMSMLDLGNDNVVLEKNIGIERFERIYNKEFCFTLFNSLTPKGTCPKNPFPHKYHLHVCPGVRRMQVEKYWAVLGSGCADLEVQHP